jgi:methylthioxylose transferase
MPQMLSAEHDAPLAPRSPSWLHRYRFDLLWGSVVVVLVIAAFGIPHLHLTWLAPVTHQTAGQYKVLAQTAPILGKWLPHATRGTVVSLVVAAIVIAWGPIAARITPWRWLVLGTWLTSAAWAMALALIDGWKRGFVGRMGGRSSFLATIPRVTSVPGLLRGFASHIVDGPGAWHISVAGDPPGALLTFVGLNRLGLRGPTWAGGFCVLVGTSAAAAVLITIRALSGEDMARRVAPFVALGPVAVWIAVSADAYFGAVAAWGLTLLALASSRTIRAPMVAAVGAGLLLGWSIYLDYGLILMGIPVLAVVIVTRNARPLLAAAIGAVAVASLFTAMGFWWFDGLTLVRQRYWAGIATDRPYAYWVWGNLASLTCAIGIAGATGLRRAFNGTALRARVGVNVLLVAFVLVIVVADLTGLSKAETERIWLPFSVWLVAAPALLPRRSHRFCLGLQALGALLINSLLLTTW